MERTWISESDTPGIWIPALPFRRCICNTHYFTRNGNSLQHSCLKNPMDREAWWATVHGVTESRTQLSGFHFTLSHRTDLKQFSSAAQSCPTPCNPMDHGTSGLPVHHQLPEFTQTHIHWVGDAIQPSHPLSSPLPPALNLSKYQGLFKWVSSSHQVAKVLEFQLQHQSFRSNI